MIDHESWTRRTQPQAFILALTDSYYSDSCDLLLDSKFCIKLNWEIYTFNHSPDLVLTIADMDEGRVVGAPGQPEQDDELTIPRAAMNKMIKELLPNIRVANEARELVLNCCTEFIHLISSESNDICNQQQKKTISAEHVLAALEKLGYGDFRKDAEEV